MPDITETIHTVLWQIELEENVRVFYACESGSRAWDFSSQYSNDDARFLYIHPLDKVFQRALDDAWDLS